MRCTSVAPEALAALALLLSAVTPAGGQADTPDTPAATVQSNCKLELANKTKHERLEAIGKRGVSIRGQPVNVALYWGSDPARAASALLLVMLRDVHQYRGLRLKYGPLATAELATFVKYRGDANYQELAIGVSTAWVPKAAQAYISVSGSEGGLAGPRLLEFNVSPVTARCSLFAWLAPDARAPDACRHYTHWDHLGNLSTVEVVGVDGCNATLQQLEKRVADPLLTHRVNRADFVHILRTANHSFLFVDYDIWKGEPDVCVVEPPPCVSVSSDCTQEIDPAIAMRVADVRILQTYAPHLFRFVHDFNPTPESLRQILKLEANGENIEEAACKWVLEHKQYKISPSDFRKYDVSDYFVSIYLCEGDLYKGAYENLTIFLAAKIHKETYKLGFNISIKRFSINCSNEYHMSDKLDIEATTEGIYRMLGVVSLTVEGAAAASVVAAARSVPLMLANVVPEDGAAEADATWRVAGRPQHIASALHHFALESGWGRVAVLSQPTTLASHYYAALKDKAKIIFHEFQIPLDLTKREAQEALQKLQNTNARIVFVNADSKAAVAILEAAIQRGMSYTDGFVWIVRDWQQNNTVECGTKHFTVSFWFRGQNDILRGYANLNDLWPNTPWPPHAVSFADALITLSLGFKSVFQRYPNIRNDLHSAQVIRSLNESLMKTPVTGVSQLLHFKERSIEETFVFVDQWCGGKFTQRLATWRVNASSGAVRGRNGARANYTRPVDMPRDDGSSACFLRSGDDFHPYCYDAACASAVLLLALAIVALLLARRVWRRRLARLKQEQQIQVIARRQHVAAVLSAYLVERDALELCEELGAGRFGSVRLARLRGPTHNPRYIAAKALRDNAAPAEESEFLREACTIASLDHAHIVRLVGVCIADGPPLVLMELAFFGDLLGYLRARRHLAEFADSEALAASGEAEHVSAQALTRLAREAAEALQYLFVRGVVHRDVRAANCLVDVRRSLKLADFGMARDTVAGTDGAPEYACRRRALFPVLWMAPESLAHGVFSAASDVWAFGVLVLELVTLGARPYGNMSPLRVLEYVAAGGSPPLPLDATPQTRGLARLCWQRTAERRPSAAEVAAYLAAWPLALRPAMLSERDEPADADSGFGESPSTELLPPDSPLQSFDQLEVLAATH